MGADVDKLGPVGVIGAGAMGSGIAQVAASAGHPVFLCDAFEGAAERAQTRIAADLAKRAAQGRITAEAATCAMPEPMAPAPITPTGPNLSTSAPMGPSWCTPRAAGHVRLPTTC